MLGDIRANAYIIDAIIGLSVVYKAFENMGGFERLLGWRPNTKLAVMVFGLFHGFGLATKIQELTVSRKRPGGQHRQLQRRRGDRPGAGADGRADRHHATGARAPASSGTRSRPTRALMMGGFVLMGYQIAGYLQ